MTITQVRSANGSDRRQKDTLRSLGLRGIGTSVEHGDSPQLRGMVHAVRHLVRAEPGDRGSEATAAPRSSDG